MTTNRYRAVITIFVDYDADNQQDASEVASRIADTVSFPAPTGRGAEIHKIDYHSRVTK